MRAHRAILEQLECIAIDLDLVLGDHRQAIASGRMTVTRRGDLARDYAIAAVAACDGDDLLRLSLYCDTRNIRRWADQAIL